MHKCRWCSSEFQIDKGGEWYCCFDCKQQGHKKLRKEHKSRYYQKYKSIIKIKTKNLSRKRLYGITEKQFQEMNITQKELCAICGNPSIKEGRMLSVDHNHSTGRVRELLCDFCNHGLGSFRENVSYLTNAIKYLNKHNV